MVEERKRMIDINFAASICTEVVEIFKKHKLNNVEAIFILKTLLEPYDMQHEKLVNSAYAKAKELAAAL